MRWGELSDWQRVRVELAQAIAPRPRLLLVDDLISGLGLGKTQEAATRNLKLLELFMADHRDVLGWIPPQGGMTAFPWLLSGENDRPFCQAATERGILLAPGDCFDAPSHFRLGFAAAGDNFSKALDRFGAFVKSWSAKMVTA